MEGLQNMTVSGIFVLALGIILFICGGVLIGWIANVSVVNKLRDMEKQNDRLHRQLVLISNNLVDLYNIQLAQLPEEKRQQLVQMSEDDGTEED